MKTITKAIIAKESKDKVCTKQCVFFDKNKVLPCDREIKPFLIKYLGLPNCSDGYVYQEER